MKICWFDDFRLGVVRDGVVRDVSAALNVLPALDYPVRIKGDPLITNLAVVREEIRKLERDAVGIPIEDVRFLAPVAAPTKIIGVPVNYLKHVEEAAAQTEQFGSRYRGTIEEQGLFLKSTSGLVGASDGVKIRFPDRRSDHEMELGVVIGKTADNVTEADALNHVAGYCIALDMVVRGTEDRSFRKSIDSYAVAGPWLVTADEIRDPGHLAFSLSVNGEMRQASNTKFMIMRLEQLISWASRWYVLHPGDIIMSGTCEGVSRVLPGDLLHCEIESIGTMDVQVSAA